VQGLLGQGVAAVAVCKAATREDEAEAAWHAYPSTKSAAVPAKRKAVELHVDLHVRARRSRPPRATTRSHESDGTDDDLEVLGGAQLATFTPLDDARRPVPAPAEPCERPAPPRWRSTGARPRPSVTATGLSAGLSAAVTHYGCPHHA
jgi:hypothetical protein